MHQCNIQQKVELLLLHQILLFFYNHKAYSSCATAIYQPFSDKIPPHRFVFIDQFNVARSPQKKLVPVVTHITDVINSCSFTSTSFLLLSRKQTNKKKYLRCAQFQVMLIAAVPCLSCAPVSIDQVPLEPKQSFCVVEVWKYLIFR